MARKVDRKRERFWQKLIARRKQSGRSVADVCWEAGVSTASFFVWQRKLRERDASSPAPAIGRFARVGFPCGSSMIGNG